MNRQDLESQLAQLESGPSDEKAMKGSIFEPLLKTWMREPKFQPDNGVDQDFRIGDRDPRYGKRQAIPRFRWPKPGEPLTPAIETEERQYWILWEQASSYLESCIRYVANDLQDREPGLSGYRELRAERWNFLLGVWAARGMEPPSEEQMKIWAETYLAELTAKSTSQSEQLPAQEATR